MDTILVTKINELWALCGSIDGCDSVESLEKDVIKFSHMIEPCRKWLLMRNKLKNIKKTPNSYNLKHKAEYELKEWIPHSVFVFSAFLEGFKLSRSSLKGDVYVVGTNIGATKKTIN